MFYSILGKEKCEDSEKISIFTDFNLNVCISYMNNLVKGYDLQKLYENIPKESETTKYRRKIDRKSTRLNSSHRSQSRMPSSA